MAEYNQEKTVDSSGSFDKLPAHTLDERRRAALADPHSILAMLDDPAAVALLSVRRHILVETQSNDLARTGRKVVHFGEHLEHERRMQ